MNKMKHILLSILTVLVSISLYSQSVNIMKLHQAYGLPGEPIVLEIEIINDDPFAALQFDILLPDGFSYVLNSVELTDRADGHQPQASVLDGGARFRGGAFAIPTKNFLGNSGVVYRFTLNTPATPGVYAMPFSTVGGQTPRITSAAGVNIITGWEDGLVTLCAPVNLTVPENVEEPACKSQDDIDTAFAAWLASVEFSGGCSPTLTTDPAEPVAPDACGGNVQVTWILSSASEPDVTESGTFSVAFPQAVDLSVPVNYNGNTCMSLQDIAVDFAAWLASASFTGGCNGVLTTIPVSPSAPDACGGSVTVQWAVSSDCDDDVVKSASFTIPDAPEVNLSVPDNYNGETCMTEQAIADDFNAWLAQAGFTGGCNGVLTRNPENPTAPDLCGGSVTVQWTVSSDCEDDAVKSATFTIPVATAIVLAPPADYTATPCEYQDQAAANDALTAWIAQASFIGGCAGVITYEPESPVAPDFCSGGSISITWFLTSDCQEVISESATFTIPAAMKGDVNCDGDLNVDDIVLMINKIFFEEPLPCPGAGDMDDDGFITTDDLVQLINIVFP